MFIEFVVLHVMSCQYTIAVVSNYFVYASTDDLKII